MDANVSEQARQRLESINGVVRALIDSSTGDIVLICHQPIDRGDIEQQARNALFDLEGATGVATIEVTYRAEHTERARVRFGGVHRTASSGSVKIRVDLEWGDESFSGEASGEIGPAMEMRSAGQATLNAISAIVGELDLRLAGVKQVRSFDAELVVVSLYAAEDPSRKFVGAVVTGAEPLRAAVQAVLSALNRLMGNYLSRP